MDSGRFVMGHVDQKNLNKFTSWKNNDILSDALILSTIFFWNFNKDKKVYFAIYT